MFQAHISDSEVEKAAVRFRLRNSIFFECIVDVGSCLPHTAATPELITYNPQGFYLFRAVNLIPKQCYSPLKIHGPQVTNS